MPERTRGDLGGVRRATGIPTATISDNQDETPGGGLRLRSGYALPQPMAAEPLQKAPVCPESPHIFIPWGAAAQYSE